MRVGALSGRSCLFTEVGAVDIERASGGRFPADPQALYEQWAEFASWAPGKGVNGARPFRREELTAPVPRPSQVFAIGLNYREHAAEAGFALPEAPAVFTKFPTSITGPLGEIALPDGDVDWEVELVVVIGRTAREVEEATAWEHVAGLTLGQDISERRIQLAGPAPQFSLGKSFPGFAPLGPWVVTPEEFADRDDISLGCHLNGAPMQQGRTGDMVFAVPELIARLSAVVTLRPGDVIFTGTPAGVGMSRSPRRFLADGDELVTQAEAIGEMRHRFVRNTGPARSA